MYPLYFYMLITRYVESFIIVNNVFVVMVVFPPWLCYIWCFVIKRCYSVNLYTVFRNTLHVHVLPVRIQFKELICFLFGMHNYTRIHVHGMITLIWNSWSSHSSFAYSVAWRDLIVVFFSSIPLSLSFSVIYFMPLLLTFCFFSDFLSHSFKVKDSQCDTWWIQSDI